MTRREVSVVILSDLHLGTYGCHVRELLDYLKSIKPESLILNGDIIDMWNFKKNYFPEEHLKVIKQIVHLASKGTKVTYLSGNHDDLLRKFGDIKMGNIQVQDQLFLRISGKQYWIFHGDVFDASIQHAKWLAKLGGKSYDLLIRINRLLNLLLERFGKEPYSFSKAIKAKTKKAVSYIQSFEEVACELAINKGYDFVICGHIHQPTIKDVVLPKGRVRYMNSGDWVENLTALEYSYGEWRLHHHYLPSREPSDAGKEDQMTTSTLLDLL